MHQDLVTFWREFDPRHAPHIHPKDSSLLKRKQLLNLDSHSYEEFVINQRIEHFDDARLHANLYPSPYQGDLAKADIFILLLNPGLSRGDYFGELNCPTLRPLLEQNIHQRDMNKLEYPFMWLDPSLCWHPGFVWWERKLRALTIEVARKRKSNYSDAMRLVAKRLASIELFPYHSVKFKSSKALLDLPSVNEMRAFANRLRKGGKLLIVTRKVRDWALPSDKNIVIYEKGQSRAAHFSKKSPAWELMLERLLA